MAVVTTDLLPAQRGADRMMRDGLSLLFRHARLIGAILVAPIVVGLAMILVTPKSFEATSRLMLLLGREYTLPSALTGGGLLSLDRNQIVNSELAILGSEPVKLKVLFEVGLARLYPDLAEDVPLGAKEPSRRIIEIALERFTKRLRLQPLAGSNVITLTFRHHDPAVAAEVLNRLVDTYLVHRTTIFAREESTVLAEQREEVRRRLAAAESRVDAFQKEHGVSDFAEQLSVLLRQQSDLDSRVAQVASDLDSMEARIAAVRQTFKGVKEQVLLYSDRTRFDAIDSAKSTLLHLELRRQELLGRYREDSRTVQDVDREIAAVKAFLEQEGPNRQKTERFGRNPIYDVLERLMAELGSERDGLIAQRASLGASLGRLQAEIDRLNRIDTDYRALVRERTVLEEAYRTYSIRLEEMRIQEQASRSSSANVRIIERALPPQEPRDLTFIVMSGCLVLGVLLALLTAFVKASTTDVFITPEGLEQRMRLRVLLTIPYQERFSRTSAEG